MDEAEQNSESQEVAPQEAENHVPDDEQQQEPQDRSGQVDQERNWRAVRQRISELEKLNADKDELIQRAMSFQQQQTQHQEPEEEILDDDFANYGGVKKLASKTVEPLKKEIDELKRELAQKKQQELVQGLRSKYKDFDDVVNPETIALFEEREPELAATIAGIGDPYKMGVQTYKYLKASGLLDEVPNKRRQKEAKQKLEKNEQTVASPQAYDKRPMAQAFKMTAQEKSKLYEEMMQFSALANTAPPM